MLQQEKEKGTDRSYLDMNEHGQFSCIRWFTQGANHCAVFLGALSVAFSGSSREPRRAVVNDFLRS